MIVEAMTRTSMIGGLGLLLVLAAPAAAKQGSHATPAPASASPSPASPPHSFYPEQIEGGVPGNLPFNNQIRKHTDPLNANGGR